MTLDATEGPQPEPLAPTLAVIVGVVASFIGLMPWLVTGTRLPVQNLWAVPTVPDEMPLVLLPYSQYTVMLIVSLLIVGASLAGLAARTLGPRTTCRSAGFTALGVLLVHTAAIAQTTVAVALGLQQSNQAAQYLALLTAVAIVSSVAGVGILLLIARAPVPGAAIGLSVTAVLLAVWLGSLTSGNAVLFTAAQWMPAVLVGLIIAWGGLRSVGRVAGALASLLVLWVGPALVTAISSAAGTQALAHSPEELLEHGVRVFLSLLDPEFSLAPLITAVSIGVVGAVALAVGRLRARRAAAAVPASEAG